MRLLREVLLSKLLRLGITEACGKPVEEASLAELQDEWARFELKRNERRGA
ncbi:hypothetical protein [Brevibacillus nitrificans]|uniref:hypothetical protein n=1 Tax=Brevibacillus nitrificans TaxID=651560 RepID=UPI002608320D|nr:hypothetical protein [Brevibacillus nitrificans]